MSIQGERIVWWAQWWWEWAWGVTGKEVKIIDYCVPATEERTWGSWENGSAGNNQDHHAMEDQVKWVESFVQRMEFPSSRFQRLKQSKLIKGPEYWHESALLKLSEDKCPWSMTEGILKGLDGSVWALNFSRFMSKGTLSHEELHGIWRTIKTILSLSQILNVVHIAILTSATLNFVLGEKRWYILGI